MFQWYPTSSNRVPLNRQGHVARMFLVCQIAVFEPFCTWTVHCTLEFRRRMVQPSAQRCDRHQNRSGYFPPLPLPMKPVGPELQLVGVGPAEWSSWNRDECWFILSIMSTEKTLLDLILDAMRKLELPPNQAFCRQVGLMLFLSPVRIIDWDWDALHVLMRTCGCHFSRDVAIMGLPDGSWGVKTAGGCWRSLLRSSCSWNPSKFSIDVGTQSFSTLRWVFFCCFFWLFDVFWTDRVYFWSFIVQFPRSLKSTASAVLVHYTWDARSTTQRPCKRSGNWAANFVYKSMDMLWHFMVQVAESSVHAIPILTNTQHDDSRKSGNQQGCIRFVDPHRVAGWTWPVAGVNCRPWCCLL